MAANEGAITGTYLLDNARDEAQVRMAGLATVYDATTLRHLQARVIAEGWNCLEVGAGSPSIPTWMAEQVGPSGSVLVTDINTRFLDTLVDPRIEVRRHDIARDPLPQSHFDLVHARLVLIWVQERDRALERIVQALKPGGWLVVEDFDSVSMPPTPEFDGPEVVLRCHLGFLVSVHPCRLSCLRPACPHGCARDSGCVDPAPRRSSRIARRICPLVELHAAPPRDDWFGSHYR